MPRGLFCGSCGRHPRLIPLGGLHRCEYGGKRGNTIDDGNGLIWRVVCVLPSGRMVTRLHEIFPRPPMVAAEDFIFGSKQPPRRRRWWHRDIRDA